MSEHWLRVWAFVAKSQYFDEALKFFFVGVYMCLPKHFYTYNIFLVKNIQYGRNFGVFCLEDNVLCCKVSSSSIRLPEH